VNSQSPKHPKSSEALSSSSPEPQYWPCNSCGGPYHEATGHVASPNQVWCGPCTRDFVRWLKGHLNRRWSKQRFYDSAYTPEVAEARRHG
jgi:capsular polysaccharide biosynthesis protein